jgi:hypothetical protein
MKPDFVTMAKGVASGYAAIACTRDDREGVRDVQGRRPSDPMDYFRDISTFGGCTAGPAAALENMAIIEDEDLLENTTAMGEKLHADQLCGALAGQARGDRRCARQGAVLGAELVADRDDQGADGRENGAGRGPPIAWKQGVIIGRDQPLDARLQQHAVLLARADRHRGRYRPDHVVTDAVDWNRAIGQRYSGQVLVEKPVDWRSYPYPFIYGQADERIFDHSNWRQCALQALGKREFSTVTADSYERDDPELVKYIALNTLPRRGIQAKPEQILITMGGQNALWLAAQVLLNQRRTAVMENPGYPGLRVALNLARCNVVNVPVDHAGMRLDAFRRDRCGVHHAEPSLPDQRDHAARAAAGNFWRWRAERLPDCRG